MTTANIYNILSSIGDGVCKREKPRFPENVIYIPRKTVVNSCRVPRFLLYKMTVSIIYNAVINSENPPVHVINNAYYKKLPVHVINNDKLLIISSTDLSHLISKPASFETR
jgi:hypothetical protein